MDADPQQFAIIFPRLNERGGQGVPELVAEVERTPPTEATDEEKEVLAKRQANAAAALLRMNHADKAWPLLKHGPDPRARSYLVHRLGPLGAGRRGSSRGWTRSRTRRPAGRCS